VTESQLAEARRLYTLYWGAHPRFNVLERIQPGTHVLDLGAGSGRAADWFLQDGRGTDLLYWHGVDLNKPKPSYAKHVEWRQLDLDQEPLPWPDDFFGAVWATHILEHLKRLPFTMREIARVARPAAIIYAETPTRHSRVVATRSELALRGYEVSIGNFSDDQTHQRPFEPWELRDRLGAYGFAPLEHGTIWNDRLSSVLFESGREINDPQMTTCGWWLKTGWAGYAIGRKRGD